MAEYKEGEYARKKELEAERLEMIHQKEQEEFGPEIGSAFFQYVHGGEIVENQNFAERQEGERDWSGYRTQFVRAVVKTLFGTGTIEEKTQAFEAILKLVEIKDDHIRRGIPSELETKTISRS